MTDPDKTSALSPDLLPSRYKMDELHDYILRQLGSPIWNVEMTKTQVLDSIMVAMRLANKWRPCPRYQALGLVNNQFEYLKGVDLGHVIVDVSFIDLVPTPQSIFYGNLITQVPITGPGLDEYDLYARWRKTWARVTSVQPDWLYDEFSQSLMIYNPIERIHCGVMTLHDWPSTERLPLWLGTWVMEYSLERSRYLYGEILAKYGATLPGPDQNLQLDQTKRASAMERIKAYETQIQSSQFGVPLLID